MFLCKSFSIAILFATTIYAEVCVRTMRDHSYPFGVVPNSRKPMIEKNDCIQECVNNYPSCKAVVFHDDRDPYNRVCTQYSVNSQDGITGLRAGARTITYEMSDCREGNSFGQNPQRDFKNTKAGNSIGGQRNLQAGWANWNQWSQCTGYCSGNQQRSRECQSYGCQAQGGNGQETRPCDCGQTEPKAELLNWSQYSQCSTSCGTGSQSRTRSCSVPNACSGIDKENKMCNQGDCAQWANWDSWGQCSQTCGQGQCTRTRQKYGLGECKGGDSTDTKSCNDGACAQWGKWGSWGQCSQTCGQGQCTRTRQKYGLGECKGGDSTDTKSCNDGACAQWGKWGSWGQCSQTCGQGECTRTRQKYGLGECNGGSSTDTKPCNRGPCAQWSEWKPWSRCSVTCGQGSKTRTRTCSQGNQCPGDNMQTESCNEGVCPSLDPWSRWSSCSVTCGTGQRTRQRTCNTGGSGYGSCDGAMEDNGSCNAGPCPSWYPWNAWSQCSASCGQGTQYRYRHCSVGDRPTACDSLGQGGSQESKACSSQASCCSWGQWGGWSGCSVTCGQGQETNQRKCNGCYTCPGGQSAATRICQMGPCSGYAAGQYQNILNQRRGSYNRRRGST